MWKFWKNKKGFLDFLFGGGDSRMEDVEVPDYHTDPDYRETQDVLKKLGIDILGGDIPEYYAPIGGMGESPEFKSFLDRTMGDITKQTQETMSAQGRGRGGALAGVTADAIADKTAELGYANYLKGIEGRQWLMDQGRGITENVRNTGQAEGAATNEFNINAFDREMEKAMYLDGRDDQEAAMKGQAIVDIASIAAAPFTGGASLSFSSFGGGGNASQFMDILKQGSTPGINPGSGSGMSGGFGVSKLGAISKGNVEGTGIFGGKFGGKTQAEILGRQPTKFVYN